MIDSMTRYSICAVVPDNFIKSDTHVMESHYISQFWSPDAAQYDQDFDIAELRNI